MAEQYKYQWHYLCLSILSFFNSSSQVSELRLHTLSQTQRSRTVSIVLSPCSAGWRLWHQTILGNSSDSETSFGQSARVWLISYLDQTHYTLYKQTSLGCMRLKNRLRRRNPFCLFIQIVGFVLVKVSQNPLRRLPCAVNCVSSVGILYLGSWCINRLSDSQ